MEASATDYFEAFSQIRVRLERERLIPFCYGAVWMSSRQAYRATSRERTAYSSSIPAVG